MKIIDIGICIDNNDPLGIGRIRVARYNDYKGQVERALKYNAWDEKDIFVANPFLPNNMNFIPEINQSVKILTYNTAKDTLNIEYIAGPFNTMYDYNGQTFSQQVSHTTYGTVNKKKKEIFAKTGEYVEKLTYNAFAKIKDFAVYGKNGSDVLFTENGLILRGGKLLSKDASSEVNRENLVDLPIMAKKSSRLYLKKFPKKMVLEQKADTKVNIDSKDLKYIIEYDCESISDNNIYNGRLYADENTPMTINFYVYKVLNAFGNTFKTNYFNASTTYSYAAVKLINNNDSNSTPTYTTTVSSIQEAYLEIRHLIYDIHQNGLLALSPFYDIEDVHPFYFKPTKDLLNRSYPETGSTFNRLLILNNINVMRVGPNNGLIFDKGYAKPKSSSVDEIIEVPVILPDSAEQTFSSLTADKIYFLSTDLENNELEKPIEFGALNQYEYTQEDYINKIEKSTYSTVRGENLLRILQTMIDVIFTHRHNPLMPIIGQQDYEQGNSLKELYKTLENDILNKSIRIN
jgi:hypothetical protein